MTDQHQEIFHAGGYRLAAAWVVAVGFPIDVILYVSIADAFGLPDRELLLIEVLSHAALFIVWLAAAWGLWNRSRPVVEISGDELRFGSIAALSRKSVRRSDVTGYRIHDSRIDIETRSQGRVVFRMPELSKRSKTAARTALIRWLGEPASA